MKQFCIAFVSLVLAVAAQASPVTYTFTATVTDDPYGLSSYGAPISGRFVFDSGATDSIADASTGSYLSSGTGFGFSVDVDGTGYAIDGNLAVNTANGIGYDMLGVIATQGGLSLELVLQDSTSRALSSDALPGTFPALSAFDVTQFRLFSDDAEFLGSLASLTCTSGCTVTSVPEPSTAALLGGALIAWMVCRRVVAPRRREPVART